jgi:hypothetical protein
MQKRFDVFFPTGPVVYRPTTSQVIVTVSSLTPSRLNPGFSTVKNSALNLQDPEEFCPNSVFSTYFIEEI